MLAPGNSTYTTGFAEALQTITGGQAGGWPASFAGMIDDIRGLEFAPIDFEIADDLGYWRVEVPRESQRQR